MQDIWIDTPRLILRTASMSDLDAVASSWRLDEEPLSRAEAKEKLDWMRVNHSANLPGQLAHLCLAIVDRETRTFIGWCGLDHLDRTQADPALFYLFKGDYWGRGLATEAAEALLTYAFSQLKLASLHGGAAADNLASKRVMEKLGLRYVGRSGDGGFEFVLTAEEFWSERTLRATRLPGPPAA